MELVGRVQEVDNGCIYENFIQGPSEREKVDEKGVNWEKRVNCLGWKSWKSKELC